MSPDPTTPLPLSKDNLIVHALWIGERLSLLECLTIKLLQLHGHVVHLWSYEEIQNVPSGVVRRDAGEILPPTTIFKYAGEPLPTIPNGGIGSLSHWSDRFQMRLLELEGGIYIQLDVAVLRPLNFTKEFAFVPHMPHPGGRDGVAAFLMKCPKGSRFPMEAYRELASTIDGETIKTMDWDCSMRKMNSVLSAAMPDPEQYFIEAKNFLDLGGGDNRSGPFFEPTPIHPDVFILHWSNATHHETKDEPIPGSVYHQLLKRAGLV